MSTDALPFDPDRKDIYTPAELFDKFDPADSDSYARCRDMAIYSYFVANGKNPTHNQEAAALEARHDNSIGTALMRLLDNSPMSSP